MYLVFNAIENSNTDAEKGYALLAELVVGLIFGALAATITNGKQFTPLKLQMVPSPVAFASLLRMPSSCGSLQVCSERARGSRSFRLKCKDSRPG